MKPSGSGAVPAHKSSHAIGGTDVLTPADIGAATSTQGAKADTAVQPNTSPVFSTITVNGGGTVAAFTGNVAASIFSVNPHIAIGYPSGTYHSFSAYGQLSWTNGGFDFTAPRDVGLGRDSAGRLEVNDGVTRGQFRDLKLRNLFPSGGCVFRDDFTVATLPSAASNQFGECVVTDANAPSVGATVASGGSADCVVISNGTNWIVTALL